MAMHDKYNRRQPYRQTKEEVLIVCGGQTEKLYFEAFERVFRPSLGKISIVTAVEAKSPLQIVGYAIKARKRKDSYNAVWCVFDKDEFPDFDEAIDYAKAVGISAAFSNQAFEVWFINHFRFLKSPLNRTHYKEELGRFLTFDYDKSMDVVGKVCDELLTPERTKTAIANARLGYEQHVAEGRKQRQSDYESCTTVYKLAKSLLTWSQ
jgi:hypothetical protein